MIIYFHNGKTLSIGGLTTYGFICIQTLFFHMIIKKESRKNIPSEMITCSLYTNRFSILYTGSITARWISEIRESTHSSPKYPDSALIEIHVFLKKKHWHRVIEGRHKHVVILAIWSICIISILIEIFINTFSVIQNS